MTTKPHKTGSMDPMIENTIKSLGKRLVVRDSPPVERSAVMSAEDSVNRRPKLSVAIITRDEEPSIRACLESVSWADEIVVLDSGSTDATVEICRSLGARVESRDWRGFGVQYLLMAQATWLAPLAVSNKHIDGLPSITVQAVGLRTDQQAGPCRGRPAERW